MVIAVLAEGGAELARGAVRSSDDGSTLVVDRVVSGKGRLFRYYFTEGLRTVDVEVDGEKLRGTLQTRWLGQQRVWLVCVSRAAPLPRWPARAAAPAAG